MNETTTSKLPELNPEHIISMCSHFDDNAKLNEIFQEALNEHLGQNKLFDLLYNECSHQNQLRSDMYLRLYDRLSTVSIKETSSVPKFLRSTEFQYAPNLTYRNKDTCRRLLKKLHLVWAKTPICYIPAAKESGNDPNIVSKVGHTLSNDFFTTGTRLQEYFYDHVKIHSPKQLYNSDDTGAVKSTKKHHRYDFYASGKWFLSVLLRAVNERTSPYTKPALHRLSAKNVKDFFLPLFYAYAQEEVHSNTLERLLFLRNFEYVYRPSLFHAALRHWNKALSSTKKSDFLCYLNMSLALLWKLNTCPFDSARLLFFEHLMNSTDPHSDLTQIYNELEECYDILLCINCELETYLGTAFPTYVPLSEEYTSLLVKQIPKSLTTLENLLCVETDFSWSILETDSICIKHLKERLKKQNPTYSEESAQTTEEIDTFINTLFKAFSKEYNKTFFPVEHLDPYISFFLIRDFYNPLNFGTETSYKITTGYDSYLNYILNSMYPDQ